LKKIADETGKAHVKDKAIAKIIKKAKLWAT